MHLFISKDKTRGRLLSSLIRLLFLVFCIAAFVLAVSGASSQSRKSQKEALEKALSAGAVRTYALTGAYPQSLEELLRDYHITYTPREYIVEYTPTGSNLFPSIFVLPVRKGGTP